MKKFPGNQSHNLRQFSAKPRDKPIARGRPIRLPLNENATLFVDRSGKPVSVKEARARYEASRRLQRKNY